MAFSQQDTLCGLHAARIFAQSGRRSAQRLPLLEMFARLIREAEDAQQFPNRHHPGAGSGRQEDIVVGFRPRNHAMPVISAQES